MTFCGFFFDFDEKEMMRQWYDAGFFTDELPIREKREAEFQKLGNRKFVSFTINVGGQDDDYDDPDEQDHEQPNDSGN